MAKVNQNIFFSHLELYSEANALKRYFWGKKNVFLLQKNSLSAKKVNFPRPPPNTELARPFLAQNKAIAHLVVCSESRLGGGIFTAAATVAAGPAEMVSWLEEFTPSGEFGPEGVPLTLRIGCFLFNNDPTFPVKMYKKRLFWKLFVLFWENGNFPFVLLIFFFVLCRFFKNFWNKT